MDFSKINLCVEIVIKQLCIESGALWIPAMLDYIFRTVNYQAAVPTSRIGQDGRACLIDQNYFC